MVNGCCGGVAVITVVVTHGGVSTDRPIVNLASVQRMTSSVSQFMIPDTPTIHHENNQIIVFLLQESNHNERMYLKYRYRTGRTSVTLLLLFLLFNIVDATSSGSTTGSIGNGPTSSTNIIINDIRALDEYGNAQQLQHATQAANRHGRPMVILTNMPPSSFTSSSSSSSSTCSAVWILSPVSSKQRHHPHHRQDDTNFETPASSLLHPISPSSYLIATGIGGDIYHLRQQLRLYYKYNYERYNNNNNNNNNNQNHNGMLPLSSSSSPPPKVTSILQLLLRQFWDYPTGDQSDDSNENEESSGPWLPMGYRQILQEQSAGWGRPFGICGIVLQWHTVRQQYVITDEFDPTGIVVVPSGTFNDDKVDRTLVCLGPQHELVHAELLKIEQLRQRHNITGSSRNIPNNGTTRHHQVSLEQQIMSAMEGIRQNPTNPNNNNNVEPPPQYQLEILNPPSAPSSPSSNADHCIRIIPYHNETAVPS
jgi:hypothetical protein